MIRRNKTPAGVLRRAVAKAKTWKAFGKALQAFRMAAGLSVRQVAGLVYVSSSTVSERENGHRKFPDRKALTDYLKVCNADDELIVFCFQHYQRIAELLSTPGWPRSPRYWLGKIYRYGLVFLAAIDVVTLAPLITGSSAPVPEVDSSVEITPVRSYWGWGDGRTTYQGSDTCMVIGSPVTTTTVDGAAAYMSACSHYAEDWRITTPVSPGAFNLDRTTIVNVKSGKCLDVTDTGIVIQKTCTGKATQSWQLGNPRGSLGEFVSLGIYNSGRKACLTANFAQDKVLLGPTYMSTAECLWTNNDQVFWVRSEN